MRTFFSVSSGLLLFFFTATCRNVAPSVQLTGTLEKQGITTYQYGTHTLSTDDAFFALTSDVVDLDAYLNQEVRIKAVEIEGYPVDGGPTYLRVLEVK